MPLRIASQTRRISRNGAMLHRAMLERLHSRGADSEPSEAERALTEERRLLKEERAKRQAQALQPKAKAADKLVRTHRSQPKEKPKAAKEAKEAKHAKELTTGKSRRPSRAEKHATKAAALEAAKHATRKSAKS